jgi:hypothetical protein
MKKIYIAAWLLVAFFGCKSNFSIAKNPDKSSFNSGTIGSSRSTNYLPNADLGAGNLKDSSSSEGHIAKK